MPFKIKDITNTRYGNLVVKEYLGTFNKNAKWLCICDCGKLTAVYAFNLKKGDTTSCGCVFKHRMRGSNNPSYKDGRTPLVKKVRNSKTYALWRNQVFSRDNYTCQKCNKRGSRLHAHHIRSFATNPKLRTELNNGITLCEHCHLSFHQRYGKYDNNKRQLNSFMKLPT